MMRKRKFEQNSLKDLRIEYVAEIEKVTEIIQPISEIISQYSVKVISYDDTVIIMESGETFCSKDGDEFKQYSLPFTPIHVSTNKESALFIDSDKNLWALGNRFLCLDRPRLWETGPIESAYFLNDGIVYLKGNGDIVDSTGNVKRSDIKKFRVFKDMIGAIKKPSDTAIDIVLLDGGLITLQKDGLLRRHEDSAVMKLENKVRAIACTNHENFILLDNGFLEKFGSQDLTTIERNISEIFSGQESILIVNEQGSLILNDEIILY